MRLRALAVTTALVLAVAGLSACTSKIGLAATVGSHRISQKDVDLYLNPSGPSAAAVAQQQGQPIAPRLSIVNTLVRHQLFLAALELMPQGAPSQAELRSKYDAAAQQISQGQVGGGAAFDSAFARQVTSLGFRSSFTGLYLETTELELTLVDRTHATSANQVLAAIAAAHAPVSISPRYGSWDPSTLSLSSSTTAGLPPFVTIGSDSQAGATPAPGQ